MQSSVCNMYYTAAVFLLFYQKIHLIDLLMFGITFQYTLTCFLSNVIKDLTIVNSNFMDSNQHDSTINGFYMKF